jgi:hypothetical protein
MTACTAPKLLAARPAPARGEREAQGKVADEKADRTTADQAKPGHRAQPHTGRAPASEILFQMARAHATGIGSGGRADGRMAAFTRSGRAAPACRSGPRRHITTPAIIRISGVPRCDHPKQQRP